MGENVATMFRLLAAALLVATALAVPLQAPSGKYCAKVPIILDMTIDLEGTTMNFDMNVHVAHKEIKCPTESIATSDTSITFPNIQKTGDCMGDALRSQKKDVTKFNIAIDS